MDRGEKEKERKAPLKTNALDRGGGKDPKSIENFHLQGLHGAAPEPQGFCTRWGSTGARDGLSRLGPGRRVVWEQAGRK